MKKQSSENIPAKTVSTASSAAMKNAVCVLRKKLLKKTSIRVIPCDTIHTGIAFLQIHPF
jgi:hypothetical protein